jgi:1,4-dihydroxy-2-naphthoyl-CoA hydrolase
MFSYDRYLHFRETDAAGVVYFSEVLNLCHEAYEASLRAAGIDLKAFFSATETTIVPIVHAEVNFFKPLHCGDRIWIDLTLAIPDPTPNSKPNSQLDSSIPSEFELTYKLYTTSDRSDRPVAQAKTLHVCVTPATRQRQDCSLYLGKWMALLQTTPTVP